MRKLTIVKLCRIVLFLSLTSLPCQAGLLGKADTVCQGIINQFSFLPEYYLQTDLAGYTLQKNAVSRQQHLAEWNTSTSFVFLSVLKNRLQSVWDVDFWVGMGNIPGDIVFTILSASFGVAPSFKINLDQFDIVTGLDHRCFHRVDRTDYGIVYWNRAFLEARSNNWRVNEYWLPLGIEKKWALKDRISYRIGTGYYVKEFFGLVEPLKIDGNNHRFGEAYVDGRYAFYHRRSWVLVGTEASKIGLFSSTGIAAESLKPYWQQEIGFEAYFCRGKRGAMFYSKYILDHLPKIEGMPDLSKDHLLQFGIRFFN
jgi:hypothetical protein